MLFKKLLWSDYADLTLEVYNVNIFLKDLCTILNIFIKASLIIISISYFLSLNKITGIDWWIPNILDMSDQK